MTTITAQDFLFQRIKALLPPNQTIVDAISELLNISTDSAYRRIRGETLLVLDEVSILCNHFSFSMDQLLNLKTNSVLFQNIRVDTNNYSYEQYLQELVQLMQQADNFLNKEIIYLTKDIPIFHNFYFSPLAEFRYYFWMKYILRHPDFSDKHFQFDCLPPTIEVLSKELIKLYTKIPSVEIWNTECVNSTISQIEFCKDSGHFLRASDIKKIYEALEMTILHLQWQAENGYKFLPGEEEQIKRVEINFFYNRVILGDNTILVSADQNKTAYLNYDVLNYITTTDVGFCNQCHEDLKNIMRKSTLISKTSEKQRNIFFSILLTKIQDRKNILV